MRDNKKEKETGNELQQQTTTVNDSKQHYAHFLLVTRGTPQTETTKSATEMTT